MTEGEYGFPAKVVGAAVLSWGEGVMTRRRSFVRKGKTTKRSPLRREYPLPMLAIPQMVIS